MYFVAKFPLCTVYYVTCICISRDQVAKFPLCTVYYVTVYVHVYVHVFQEIKLQSFPCIKFTMLHVHVIQEIKSQSFSGVYFIMYISRDKIIKFLLCIIHKMYS